MCADKFERAIKTAWSQGYEPFFVNTTAGTTVMSAYDPLEEIADVCRAYGSWFHMDASWGGSVVFSDKYRFRLNGAERTNNLTVNPHKMLGVPVTCSFLLTSDLRKFHRANSLPVGYLFHDVVETSSEAATGDFKSVPESRESEVWDLADLTLQCGRKGDALKLALGWVYYGSVGYGQKIENALDIANHLSTLICAEPDLVPVGPHPVPCLQVCFYFAPGGILATVERNTAMTKAIAARLVECGFMTNYTPGEHGSFLRVVVNISTKRQTVERTVREILRLGRECSEASATPGILRTQRADLIPEAG
jgi:glutamate decarboxylase